MTVMSLDSELVDRMVSDASSPTIEDHRRASEEREVLDTTEATKRLLALLRRWGETRDAIPATRAGTRPRILLQLVLADVEYSVAELLTAHQVDAAWNAKRTRYEMRALGTAQAWREAQARLELAELGMDESTSAASIGHMMQGQWQALFRDALMMIKDPQGSLSASDGQ